MSEKTHLVVGAGRMGGALLSGWTSGRRKSVKAENLLILDPRPGKQGSDVISAGAKHVKNIGRKQPRLTHVLLAVKPQMFDDIAPLLAPHLPRGCLVISILAGTTLQSLEAVFPEQHVIRAMPNTPAAIGAGITAFTCGAGVSTAQRKSAKKLLSAGGSVFEVDSEHLIDVVTAVSGSGPAYLFHLTEALEAAALTAGLTEDLAPAFARQTIIGSAELLRQSDESPADLRKAVTSPGGTTQAALDVLMSPDGLPPLMREAVNAALKRAKELGQGK